MKKCITGLVLMLLVSISAIAEDLPFNILAQDQNVVVDIRADGDDVWIKLASANTNDNIIVRISDKPRDYYRPWFHGEVDLVSTGFRGNNVWSDRVQTKAPYIEYWHGENLVLHLERK